MIKKSLKLIFLAAFILESPITFACGIGNAKTYSYNFTNVSTGVKIEVIEKKQGSSPKKTSFIDNDGFARALIVGYSISKDVKKAINPIDFLPSLKYDLKKYISTNKDLEFKESDGQVSVRGQEQVKDLMTQMEKYLKEISVSNINSEKLRSIITKYTKLLVKPNPDKPSDLFMFYGNGGSNDERELLNYGTNNQSILDITPLDVRGILSKDCAPANSVLNKNNAIPSTEFSETPPDQAPPETPSIGTSTVK